MSSSSNQSREFRTDKPKTHTTLFADSFPDFAPPGRWFVSFLGGLVKPLLVDPFVDVATRHARVKVVIVL